MQNIRRISSCLSGLIIKKRFSKKKKKKKKEKENYSKQLFCQAIKILFKFRSRQNSLSSYKNIVLIFFLIRTVFFNFSLYKIVDSEYTTDNWNNKMSEMVKLVPDHLKTKTIRKYAIKKLHFGKKCSSSIKYSGNV